MIFNLIVGAFLGLPLLMLMLYVVGIQFERPTLWTPLRYICVPVALIALFLDVILNWSLFSVYLRQWPEYEITDTVQCVEWTFSERINRLCLERSWQGRMSLAIGRFLNFFAYGNDHIPNAKKQQPQG